MKILDRLLDFYDPHAQIQDVTVGLAWTLACVNDNWALAASAFRWENTAIHGKFHIPDAGSLEEIDIDKIREYYNADNYTARAVALAVTSAATRTPLSEFRQTYDMGAQDVARRFIARQKHADFKIAFIGHFCFVHDLPCDIRNIMVFELDHRCRPGDIPASQIPQRLPEANLVVITASSLITRTAESLLKHCSHDAVKLLVGPSCPVHPALFEFDVDALCVSDIKNGERLKKMVSQGGSHRQLGDIDKKTLVNPRSNLDFLDINA